MKLSTLLKLSILPVAALLLVAMITSCEKEVSMSGPKPPPPEGIISVSSTPPGYDIYLDGRKSGKVTPDSLFWLEERNHKVTLKRELFKDTSLIARDVDSAGVHIDVNYYNNNSMYGSIRIITKPSRSEVFIDDSATGKETPTQFKGVWPGHYQFKFKKAEHRTDSVIITVESDHQTYIIRNLTDTSVWVGYREDNSNIPSNSTTSIVVDNYTTWFGTRDAGLVKFVSDKFTTYNTMNSVLPANQINYLHLDTGGNLWIATEGGVVKKNSNSWQVYNVTNSEIPDNSVNSIKEDHNGVIWIATDSGVAKYEGGIWTAFTTQNTDIKLDRASNLGVDYQNNIWVCTLNSGISEYRDNTWYSKDTSVSNYPSNTSTAIGFQNNTKWVGFLGVRPSEASQDTILGSLSKIVKEGDNFAWKNYLIERRIYNIDVIDGEVWASTSAGLVRFHDIPEDGIEYRTINSRLRSDVVKDIFIDKNKTLWIATDGGGIVKNKDPY